MIQYKYKLKATSMGMGGVVHRKKDNTIFDPSSKKWEKFADQIVASFKDGHLEMTKDSAKQYEADKKKVKTESEVKAEKKK